MKKRPDSINQMIEQAVVGLVTPDEGFRRIWSYIPFPRMIPFHASRKKIKALQGGNRCGKTKAVLAELVSLYTRIAIPGLKYRFPVEELSRDDWCKIRDSIDYAEQVIDGWMRRQEWPLLFPYDKYNLTRPTHTSIIVGDYEKHWPEVFRMYLVVEGTAMLPAEFSRNFDEEAHRFDGPNGETLSIQSPGTSEHSKKMKGAQKDYVMIDETCSRFAYTESLMRTIDRQGTVALSYCPQHGKTWQKGDLEDEVFDEDGNRRVPEPEAIFLDKVSMRDNPTLSDDEIRVTLSTLKPHERAARESGNFAEAKGDAAFEPSCLAALEPGIKPGQKCRFENIHIDAENGEWTGKLEPATHERYKGEPLWLVWEEPQPGHFYIMAADPSEGWEKSDWQAVGIWDLTCDALLKSEERAKLTIDQVKRIQYNTPQVAQLRCKLNPCDQFGDQCCLMGNIYGNCLFVIETMGQAAGIVIQRCRAYLNLYTRLQVDRITEKPTTKIGWHTDKWAKAKLVATCNSMLLIWRELHLTPIHSEITLAELKVYESTVVRNAIGDYWTQYAAMQGSHDDTVMEAMIALQVGLNEKNLLTSVERTSKLYKDVEDEGTWVRCQTGVRNRRRIWRSGLQTRSLKQLRDASKRRRSARNS